MPPTDTSSGPTSNPKTSTPSSARPNTRATNTKATNTQASSQAWHGQPWAARYSLSKPASAGARADASTLDIDEAIFDHWNIHIHVPEGAIPKDGPSAGITMATSLASALTQRKVKANLAMTGEITLRGKVLPVGGIKEKILAAKRAGIKEIILCEENRKNIEEIQEMYLKGLSFHYVKDIQEVFALALTDEKVADAIDFSIPQEKTEKKEE